MAEREQAKAPQKHTPTDFLTKIIGQKVHVRLNSGIDYHGRLASLDGFMNIALEETDELVGGTVKHSYGDAFIRGNNVLYISAVPGRAGEWNR